MTFLIAAFTAITSSGSVFLAATNLVGVTPSTLGTVSGFASILSGAGAIFGAVSSIESGRTAAANANFERDQLLVEGKITAANAKKAENDARETLLANLAATNAAASASGIQITSGSVQSGREAASRQANRELSTIRTDEQIRAAGRRAKAAKLRIDANVAKKAGRRDAVVGTTMAASRSLSRG